MASASVASAATPGAPRITAPGTSCRLLVAAAGYGKTTTLRRWFPQAASCWYRATTSDQLIEFLRHPARTEPRPIVVDDLPQLPPDAVQRLVQAVDELPPAATVVLAARWPIAALAPRWLGRGVWAESGPAELRLPAGRVAELLDAEYGLADADLARRVHDATGGWPALVHMAGETLLTDGVPAGPLAPALARPGSPLATYLADEILAGLPQDALRLLRHAGTLVPLTADLCRTLGHRRAAEMLRLLGRVGVVTRTAPPVAVCGGPGPQERVVPVVAEVARHGRRRSATATAATAATAARWYAQSGPPLAAARAFRQAGDLAAGAQILDRHGDALLAAGHAEAVAELLTELPAALLTRRLRLLLGDARRAASDLDAAAREYARVADAQPEWDAAVAWRIGRVHHQRGDARGALRAFARCPVPPPDADGALLLAYTAHAHALAGDADTATGYAQRAVALARDVDDDDALATAYASVGLCRGLAGDAAGSEAHYALAIPLAERAGDLALLARIYTNRTVHLLSTARYAQAQATAQQCARYAEAAGSPDLRAVATCNEADALLMLGRYDEAVRRYEQALALYHRMGSRRVAGAHLGLGEVYRRRGWREQARAAYEQAVRVAEDAGNVRVLVPALTGLALVLLDDDPGAAAAHVERAAADAGVELTVTARLAQGWSALSTGDVTRSAEFAAAAARTARAQRDLAGLADALELRAATETDQARARDALREAHAIWAGAGAVVEAARILVALSRLPGATTDDRLRGLLAAEQLAGAGAAGPSPSGVGPAAAGAPGTGGQPAAPGPVREVVIRAFGRFEVLLGDRGVPASLWQSRKARDLLRILVARRGRPVPRSELCELLWPDDDPDRTGHRLSVLLSIVRGVLDPDKTHPTDHYLVADRSSIALDITRIRVDVEEYLAHVAHARRLVDRGCLAEARTLLLAVDRQYRADAFEDEPYAAWCSGLREEARAAQVRVLRMLAQVSRVEAGPEVAVEYLLRLLDRDPYDESAHRALVRTLVADGQHGEARRAFARYGEAMRSIGVRPPDEAILLPARRGRPA